MREALPSQYQGFKPAQVAAKAAARFLVGLVARRLLRGAVSFGLPGALLGRLLFVF